MNIRVEPARREWVAALSQGDAQFTERFGPQVEPGWEGFPETLPILLAASEPDKSAAWGPHLFFDGDGVLVGNGGWKGPPVNGESELGYAVAPGVRGRGIATAAVRVLLARAREAGLRTAAAHTLAEESASTAVLRRCGFTKVSEVIDPEDGVVWRWEADVATVTET
ncbi:MAG: GNAT family N-acetyltransferase [Actinobacteria bacterium]|nr:GNAT family N-acetyltransferase [Actinomycetota bacterium]